jgi:hypothetical protein
MMTRRKTRLLILAAVTCAAAVVLPVTATAAVRAAPRPFQLNGYTPQSPKLVPNGPAVSLTITWSGQAAFPVTAYLIPAATCSSKQFTCGVVSHRFKSGSNKLSWRNALSCTGKLGKPFTGHTYLYLVNARGKYTVALPLAFVCEY